MKAAACSDQPTKRMRRCMWPETTARLTEWCSSVRQPQSATKATTEATRM